jgi:BirA family transcriptional regulator, biotin operon repressor / biotin---[acetyl-CoA-carboxylase] ligase
VIFGRPHRHYALTDSTNARAKELAEAGAPGGLIVTAAEQTAGRGRHERSWFGRPGASLLYSALLRPYDGDPLLPLAVPLAVCEAAEAVAPVRCQVKWPNDVWIDERKVAGVLIEARPDQGWAVIGIGLNVAVPEEEFPPELRGQATSLAPTDAEGGVDVGGAPTMAAALRELNLALGRWVEASGEEVLGPYRARDALVGRRVSWDGGAGVAAGVDGLGHLIVDVGGGAPVVLGAGEVHLAVA